MQEHHDGSNVTFTGTYCLLLSPVYSGLFRSLTAPLHLHHASMAGRKGERKTRPGRGERGADGVCESVYAQVVNEQAGSPVNLPLLMQLRESVPLPSSGEKEKQEEEKVS